MDCGRARGLPFMKNSSIRGHLSPLIEDLRSPSEVHSFSSAQTLLIRNRAQLSRKAYGHVQGYDWIQSGYS